MAINIGNLLKSRMAADKTAELSMQLGLRAARELTDEEVKAVTGGGGPQNLLGGDAIK